MWRTPNNARAGELQRQYPEMLVGGGRAHQELELRRGFPSKRTVTVVFFAEHSRKRLKFTHAQYLWPDYPDIFMVGGILKKEVRGLLREYLQGMLAIVPFEFPV